jgi:hypothetical protein
MEGIQIIGVMEDLGSGTEILDDAGATVNSGISIQGATSPRTMRPDRIIKYRDK